MGTFQIGLSLLHADEASLNGCTGSVSAIFIQTQRGGSAHHRIHSGEDTPNLIAISRFVVRHSDETHNTG